MGAPNGSRGSSSSSPGCAATRQARLNAAARAEFLRRWPCLTPSDVAALVGSTGSSPDAFAHTLARGGQVFSVHHRGKDFYPAFQFDQAAARPKPAIADVLNELQEGAGLRGWELAFWFTDGNAWLPDEKTPLDLLDTNPEVVVEAARHEREIPW